MIIRRKHTANFTTIGNALLNDERLEADEVGILAFLLSRPENWEVRRPALARRFRVGRDSIKRILFNCIRFGWIVAKKTRLSNGTYYTIYEVRDDAGPELSPEQVKAALSLVSSEAGHVDDAEGDGADQLPETGDPDTGQPGAASQLRQTRPGPIEDSLKTDSVKTESTNAAWAFSDVSGKWPTDHILSTVAAETAFASLTESQQAACYHGVSPYLDDCKSSTRKICDLTTYIRERRWERFQTVKTNAATTTIKAHSPEFYRWREYRLQTGDHTQVKAMDLMAQRGSDITVPSRWPPAKQPAGLSETDAKEFADTG